MVIRALIVFLLLGAAAAYAHALGHRRVSAAGLPELARLPAAPEGWTSRELATSSTVVDVLAADVTTQRVYRNAGGDEVHVFVAYFAEQAVNSQIHSPRQCLPGSGWRIASSDRVDVPVPGGSQPATRLRIERGGASQELLYWFRTRSGTVNGEYALKWDLTRNSLARRPTDAAFIRFAGPAEKPEAVRSLIAVLHPALLEILGDVGLQ